MNRNEALLKARELAKEHEQIVIVYQAVKKGEWYTCSYRTNIQVEDSFDIRYVLPNGEVTKLS